MLPVVFLFLKVNLCVHQSFISIPLLNMKSSFIEEEKSKPLLFNPCSLKTGKKYIFILIATKVLIIWYVCVRNTELYPIPHSSFPAKPAMGNVKLYDIDLVHIPLTAQKDMLPYYVKIGSETCFLNGLNLKTSNVNKKCKCLNNWFGLDCGIPETVWTSYLQQGKKQGVQIRRRNKPRRIIYSVVLMDEFSLLDLMIQDVFHSVDIFLLAVEGSNKSLLLALKNGYLLEFQSKLMLFQINNTNMKFKDMKDWTYFMFNTLWSDAWKHITDLRPDDLFIFLHVSSLISKDVLMFFKFYDGYSEPFYYELRPLLYKFKLLINSTFSENYALFPPLGCTFEYFYAVCNSDIKKLYSNTCVLSNDAKLEFEKNFWNLQTWLIGSIDKPSGWQCNFCLKVNEITIILKKHEWLLQTLNIPTTFAHNSTIYNLIKHRKWLNGSVIEAKIVFHNDSNFAPETIMNDPKKYAYLLDDQKV